MAVSTHSRPKAAGAWIRGCALTLSSFNTQPPEGGWAGVKCLRGIERGFNTQPPEGGWSFGLKMVVGFSGFNTQPPEGGWLPPDFNGRTKEGFQHTAA